VPAVQNVTFTLKPGQVLGYLGPNGSGKSTTVKMLTGLLEPTRGQVVHDGCDIHENLLAYRKHLGYVPEEANLYPYLTGEEYLEMVGTLRAMPEALLYEYDGFEPGTATLGHKGEDLLRLKFHPNPDYDPPTRVEQLLTGMTGILLVDPQRLRLARIDGKLEKDVAFGWGSLGHLDKGGHILMDQGELPDGNWALRYFTMRFTGKVVFFKNIDVNTTETSWDFHRVADDLSFAQGLQLLKQQEAEVTKNASLSRGLE